MHRRSDECKAGDEPASRPDEIQSDGPEIPVESAPSELRYLANFERLIITLSGRFINLSRENIDREISRALKAIGTFAEVDRSYIFQFSLDGARVSNTHEWCAEGIQPAIDGVQDVPVEFFSWIMPRIKRGEVIHIPDVSRLPDDAAKEKEEMQAQRIQSLINVPLTCANKVLGFVGLDSVRTRKDWRADHIKLLKVVGEIIAGTIERERATAALTRQVQMEKLVAYISTRFINVPTDELHDEIGSAIGKIGAFTGVDRSYVFQFSPDGKRMSNTHEWCALGIEPHVDRLQGWSVDGFGHSMALMQRGAVFHVPDVSALPEEAGTEKAEFEQEGIKTLINVPIMARGRMTGFLGMDAVRTHKAWSDDDIRLLRLVGEILAHALARKSAEERLQHSLQEKEVLLREIHHRVKNNMQVIHSLLYLQVNAIRDRVDPVALEAFRQSQTRIKSMATIHDRLYRSKDLTEIDFEDYLHALIPDLLQLYNIGDRVRTDIEAKNTRLDIDTAIPCGLIVNELVANSLEHAFPGRRRGRIDIVLKHRAAGLLELTVADDGVGLPPGYDWRSTATLGLQLVNDLVDQLDGEAMLDTGEGTRFDIRFATHSS
ncbi:MAG: histidine kinase dimerization/phosphoacceptor domain -containing protein [Pseudomonadota bacterium]|nr:histidine kinase dimerization/phosphoacceptor domain -containing protein [Pseudomonadota bacterium]